MSMLKSRKRDVGSKQLKKLCGEIQIKSSLEKPRQTLPQNHTEIYKWQPTSLKKCCIMKAKNKIPDSPEAWLEEIARAYLDAIGTLPFGELVGQEIEPKDLFHLGPPICLKFRAIKSSKKNLKKATDADLSSYVATKEIVGDLFDIPQMSFAFCYLVSHFGLEFIGETLSTEILDFVESRLDNLVEMTTKT